MRSATSITTPPATRATATTRGSNRTDRIVSWRATPITPAGMLVRSMLRRKAHDAGSRRVPDTTSRNLEKNSTRTARIAPLWMATSKTRPGGRSSRRRSTARIRCPVEDTGRNSVKPSSAPSRIATRKVISRSDDASSATIGQIPHATGPMAVDQKDRACPRRGPHSGWLVAGPLDAFAGQLRCRTHASVLDSAMGTIGAGLGAPVFQRE